MHQRGLSRTDRCTSLNGPRIERRLYAYAEEAHRPREDRGTGQGAGAAWIGGEGGARVVRPGAQGRHEGRVPTASDIVATRELAQWAAQQGRVF